MLFFKPKLKSNPDTFGLKQKLLDSLAEHVYLPVVLRIANLIFLHFYQMLLNGIISGFPYNGHFKK
jgi:hypothetical protein